MKAFEPTISVEIKAIWFELSIELLLLRSKCICRYVSSNFENNSFIADNLTCLKKTVKKLFERSVSIIINITLLLWSTIKLSERSRRQSFDSYIDISTCVVRFETNKKLSRSKMFQNNHSYFLDVTQGTVWLTGMPGAGKTTLANILHQKLRNIGEIFYLYLTYSFELN